MSIEKSILKYLKANITDVTTVKVPEIDYIISNEVKPFITVSLVNQKSLDTIITDQYRKQNVMISIGLYCNSLEEQIYLKEKLQRTIETATAQLADMTAPTSAIPLYGLSTPLVSTDLINYLSYQPFQTNFVPVIYLNTPIPASIINPLLYTVDYTNGIITFLIPRALTDKILADYLAGFIEVSITDIFDTKITGIENTIHKYNTMITLSTNVYIKQKINKLF